MERERIGRGSAARPDDGTGATLAGTEPSLGELLARLTADTGDLVRAEVALARAELRQAGATLARDATKLGVAAGLALAGALALTAFLVLALGDALDNYWLSALLVGLVLLAVGAGLARSAAADVKRRGVLPAQTLDTLREDAAWARQEAGAVKRELTR